MTLQSQYLLLKVAKEMTLFVHFIKKNYFNLYHKTSWEINAVIYSLLSYRTTRFRRWQRLRWLLNYYFLAEICNRRDDDCFRALSGTLYCNHLTFLLLLNSWNRALFLQRFARYFYLLQTFLKRYHRLIIFNTTLPTRSSTCL